MPNRRVKPPSRPSAFTLVELLIAMSIVAILLMVGVGFYWRMSRGFAVRAATSAIESALRSARAFAIHERGTATVVLEPQPDNANLVGQVYALGKQTVSSWHFERNLLGVGALGQQGTVTGTPPPTEGRIGGALGCGTSTDAIYVQVTSPYLDGVRDGLFAEAYVYPEATATGVLPVLCKKQADTVSYSLSLTYDSGSEVAYLGVEGTVLVDNGGPVTLTAATATAVVRNREWSHVALSYYPDMVRDGDGNLVRTGILILRVNGAEVARLESPLNNSQSGRLTQVAGSLWMGTDGTQHFAGRLDEVKIAGLVAGETYVLPKNTEVTADLGGSTDGRVHFDAEGKLDPRAHTGDVYITIISPRDQLRRVVRVNALGTVQVFDNRPPEDR